MTTIFRKITLLGMLLCLSLYASAATPEAEYKKLEKTWTLHADGSQEYRCSMALTLYTHAAMNETYGESFIVYNPLYQELRINASYTEQKDGTIVDTPANAFVEVLPKNAADAPAFNHLKEMVVVHTGLELGATIYLDYTIESKAGYLPEVDIFERLQEISPIRHYSLTVQVPVDKKLHYTLANSRAKATVKSEDGMTTTSWKLQNVPALTPASFLNLSQGDIPYLAATTYPSAAAALQTLAQQIGQPASMGFAGDNTASEADRLQAILSHVNTHIDTNMLSLEATGYRLRPVQQVWQSAFGTMAEKSVLLMSVLKKEGFDARLMASYPVDAEQGLGLKAVDHLYVAVNGKYLIDVDSKYSPQGVLFGQRPLYDVQSGQKNTDFISSDYQIESKQDLSIHDGKTTVTARHHAGKALVPYFAKTDWTEESAESIEQHNGYATLVLQENAYAFSHRPYIKLNSRRDVNLLLPRLVDETYTYTIECPENLQLCTPQTDENIRNAAGETTLSVKRDGNKIVVTRSLKLNKQLYTPSEYKQLRRLLASWGDVNGRTLLFAEIR